MKTNTIDPPRKFPVGLAEIDISHTADIYLQDDEMVTFMAADNSEYDIVKKNWGYYATPSLGGRLLSFGLKAAIMRNIDTRQCFVILVQRDQLNALKKYMFEERQEIVMWLDDFNKLANVLAESI